MLSCGGNRARTGGEMQLLPAIMIMIVICLFCHSVRNAGGMELKMEFRSFAATCVACTNPNHAVGYAMDNCAIERRGQRKKSSRLRSSWRRAQADMIA